MKAIIEFLNFLTPYGMYSYFVMYGALIACGFGLPMPEDVVLISGGILSARGVCDFWITSFVCLVGVLMGDGTIYFIGRRAGPRVKRSILFRRFMTEKNDQRIARIFEKYGDKVIFMARFMPGLRAPIFLTTGIYKVSALKFFALDGFAAIISVPLWIWVGYIFGYNLELLEQKINHFKVGLYVGLVAVILAFVGFYFIRKKFKPV